MQNVLIAIPVVSKVLNPEQRKKNLTVEKLSRCCEIQLTKIPSLAKGYLHVHIIYCNIYNEPFNI